MNAGVALTRAYLELNGYFTQNEIPVIGAAGEDAFKEITDLDVLGIRFPRAAVVVPQGDDGSGIPLANDPFLDLPDTQIDVIIAEVKEGAPG